MKVPAYIVNMDLPPAERWEFLKNHVSEINELIGCYLEDFNGAEMILQNIEMYKLAVVPNAYQEEVRFIASICDYSENEVLIANLYYDILKFYFGCTAFVIDIGSTMLHARNLDWHTENDLLSQHTCLFDFQKDGETVYKTVSWPGYIGALSGTKPGSFTVTLNAVLSFDQPEIAYPVSFLLRDVLASEESFESAKLKLEQTTIASDCLLLLSGTTSQEIAVIERTPKRFATRSGDRFITVTNDYKLLENTLTNSQNQLQSTSCGRFDRVTSLIGNNSPKDFKDCLEVLKDEEIMMGITVQQMVFDNKTGEIEVLKTGSK